MKNVSSVKKAAIILSALDKNHLSALLAMMSGEEIKILSSEIKKLKKEELKLLPGLVREFSENIEKRRILENDEIITDEVKYTGDEKIDCIIKCESKKDMSTWEKLDKIDTLTITRYLRKESAQTVAVVLSKLKPKKSAEILSAFPSSEAADIIDRILNLRRLDSEVLAGVEQSINNDLADNVPQEYDSNYSKITQILDSLKRDDETRILDALENSNLETAEKIRESMLCFEDLITVDDEEIKLLLEHIDKDKMVISLRGASDKLKNKFFKNMNSAAKKVIKNDMETFGPIKLKNIENAQYDIIVAAKELAKEGFITIYKAEN